MLPCEYDMNRTEGYSFREKQWNLRTTASSPSTYVKPSEETFYDTIRQLFIQ